MKQSLRAIANSLTLSFDSEGMCPLTGDLQFQESLLRYSLVTATESYPYSHCKYGSV